MRIHYNVTGADRKALAKVIAEITGAKVEYKGMPTAAYEIDYFTVTRDGTLEFSDRSDSEEVEAVLEALGAAGFEGIGETTEAPEQAHKTPIEADTKPQESEHTSEDRDTVELKVTMPMARHTGITLRNLINLIYTRAKLLNKALGTAFRVDEGLIKALQNDACVLTLDSLFETVEKYESRNGKAADGLCVEPDKLTFSTLPETDDPAVLHTFTTLCAMMNKQALTQQRIQAKKVSGENEKYAMRIWLLRLGMNGPEYKDERRILMKNLTGHCAFRTEKDKEHWQQKQNEKRDSMKALKQATEVSDDANAE